MTEEELSQHGLQNISIDLGRESIYELGKKEPYKFLYFDKSNDCSYVIIPDEWTIKHQNVWMPKVTVKLCDCPKINFSFNGIGCTCGGK